MDIDPGDKENVHTDLGVDLHLWWLQSMVQPETFRQLNIAEDNTVLLDRLVRIGMYRIRKAGTGFG